MRTASKDGLLDGPGIMLVSAAIFGFLGFGLPGVWDMPRTHDNDGNFVPVWAALRWSLQGSAIGFLAAALLCRARRAAGNLLYTLVGLLSAVAFVVIGIWDITFKTHAAAIPPLLLFIIAAWNGYGSSVGLRMLLARPRAAGTDDLPFGAEEASGTETDSRRRDPSER